MIRGRTTRPLSLRLPAALTALFVALVVGGILPCVPCLAMPSKMAAGAPTEDHSCCPSPEEKISAASCHCAAPVSKTSSFVPAAGKTEVPAPALAIAWFLNVPALEAASHRAAVSDSPPGNSFPGISGTVSLRI